MDVSFYGAYGEGFIGENPTLGKNPSWEDDLSMVRVKEKFIRLVEEQIVRANDSEDAFYDPITGFITLSKFYDYCVDDTHRLI